MALVKEWRYYCRLERATGDGLRLPSTKGKCLVLRSVVFGGTTVYLNRRSQTLKYNVQASDGRQRCLVHRPLAEQ